MNDFPAYMKKTDVFTPEEQDNERRKSELIELILSGEAILFVGAGSSNQVGYPDWPQLLIELESLVEGWGIDFKSDARKRKEEPLDYAEDIHNILRLNGYLDQYYAFFDRRFGPSEFSCGSHKRTFEGGEYSNEQLDFHEKLVLLPFRGILTTNYDKVIEDAFHSQKSTVELASFVIHRNAAGQAHRFFMTMCDEKKLGVAHLHGICDDPGKIVLTRSEYEKTYGYVIAKETSRLFQFLSSLQQPKTKVVQPASEWTLHRKILWAVLSTRRIVFVGFSLQDPYIREILKTVSKDLWTSNIPNHYAIMSISPENEEASKSRSQAESLLRDCGIETYFYKDLDGRHEGLRKLIDDIYDTYRDRNPDMGVHTDLVSEDPPKSEDEPDWLEEINQKMEKGTTDGHKTD